MCTNIKGLHNQGRWHAANKKAPPKNTNKTLKGKQIIPQRWTQCWGLMWLTKHKYIILRTEGDLAEQPITIFSLLWLGSVLLPRKRKVYEMEGLRMLHISEHFVTRYLSDLVLTCCRVFVKTFSPLPLHCKLGKVSYRSSSSQCYQVAPFTENLQSWLKHIIHAFIPHTKQ